MEKKENKKTEKNETQKTVLNLVAVQKEITQKTEELNKCLAILQLKKKLSDDRLQFIHAKESFERAKELLENKKEFDSEHYRLIFTSGDSYRNDDLFKISNTLILTQFIEFITHKIQEKIEQIELELIQ